jgi:uracil-DNA glycosylase
MKPLLVGEAPSKNEDIPRPLEGRVGRRLAKFAGITFTEYIRLFERVNLLAERQDTAEHGFQFDMEAAKVQARLLRNAQPQRRVVVLLGKRVAQAFDLPLFYFREMREDHDYTIIPHPSGINRWYNEERNMAEVQTFMRQLAAKAFVQHYLAEVNQ